jgi:4-amino-4-deoxy-L-arabinose transferase-like glycosyltransferase
MLKILKKYLPILTIFLIVILGFSLRLWRIDSAPKGALIDELHFGYLAKSLIETGKDEHGYRWPIIFEGFGDEKLPAMAYLNIPSVYFFDLSIFAIRLPSLLAGTLLILVVYWFIRELGFTHKWGALGALITAVSPWTFFLSRFGFESNLALLFLTAGMASLLKSQATPKNRWLILSGVLFGLTWYSYIAYRPVTIVILLTFLALTYLKNKSLIKKYSYLVIFFVITIAPLFAPNIIGVNSTRYEQVGITSDSGIEMVINEKRNFCSTKFPEIVCYATWNKPIYIFRQLTNRYLSSYSPEFLVSKGEVDTDFLTVDGYGQFYPIFYPFFIIGICGLLLLKDKKVTTTVKWLLIIGLLTTPIPSALVGDPQKVRISSLFPFVLVLIIYGVRIVYDYISKYALKTIFVATLILITLSYSYLYFVEYFGVHVIQNEYKYQSYLPELYEFVSTLSDDTIVNIRPFYSDPLMFYAFYTKMDPSLYQEMARVDEVDGAGFYHTVELGNIYAYKTSIEAIGCLGNKKSVNSVYITDQKLDGPIILYEGRASNNVHTYVYAYDASFYMLSRLCE